MNFPPRRGTYTESRSWRRGRCTLGSVPASHGEFVHFQIWDGSGLSFRLCVAGVPACGAFSVGIFRDGLSTCHVIEIRHVL